MELCDWIRRNNMLAVVGSSVEPRGIHTVQSNMPLCVNTHNRQQKRNSIGNYVSSITHAVVFDLLLFVLLLYKVNRLSTRMQSLKMGTNPPWKLFTYCNRTWWFNYTLASLTRIRMSLCFNNWKQMEKLLWIYFQIRLLFDQGLQHSTTTFTSDDSFKTVYLLRA